MASIELAAIVEQDGRWFVAFAPELPGEWAQGGRARRAIGACGARPRAD
jgi:hypothetical protein